MPRHTRLLALAALLVPLLAGTASAQSTRTDARTGTITRTRRDGSTVSTRGAEPGAHTGRMTSAPVSPLSNTPSPSASAGSELGTTAGSGSSGASASVGSSAGGVGTIGLGGIGPGGLGGGEPGTNTLGGGLGAGGGPAGGSRVGPNLNTR